MAKNTGINIHPDFNKLFMEAYESSKHKSGVEEIIEKMSWMEREDLKRILNEAINILTSDE